uniref:Uncharacterized protein n=1 Tax=Oryza brachyantha TaxID=4533 RepID=J3M824_ORYBR
MNSPRQLAGGGARRRFGENRPPKLRRHSLETSESRQCWVVGPPRGDRGEEAPLPPKHPPLRSVPAGAGVQAEEAGQRAAAPAATAAVAGVEEEKFNYMTLHSVTFNKMPPSSMLL